MPPRSAPVGALRRVLAHLRAPPARYRSRRSPFVPRAGAAGRSKREARRRSAVIEEDKLPGEAARGYCRRCAETHRLERTLAAEAEARALMDRIRASGRLDFDCDVPDPRFGVDKMYEPGGGKMLGVLLAERVRAGDSEGTSDDEAHTRAMRASSDAGTQKNDREVVVIKAFSGQLYGEWSVRGWAGPLCSLTHASPRYVAEHARIAAITALARAEREKTTELERVLKAERERWDGEIAVVSLQAKDARNLRNASRKAATEALAAAIATAREEASEKNSQTGDAVDSDETLSVLSTLETRLAEESRASKRALARLREARAAAVAPRESALAVAQEDVRRLRDEHRSLSASLLAEIFDSYRVPNFREDFGFGHREENEAQRDVETPGATLVECFVADETSFADAAAEGTDSALAAMNGFIQPVSATNLPCGCGDCCAPKLLAECALRGLRPLAIAEVWMGVSTPKEGNREEGEFYGACRGRCRPILGHMLCGADELRTGGPIVL